MLIAEPKRTLYLVWPCGRFCGGQPLTGRRQQLAGRTQVRYIKARLEERLLRRELGESAYHEYASRVPILMPFTSRRSGRFRQMTI
jgi:protein-S-isoprenylcysteine O-methyltransferase Ste14